MPKNRNANVPSFPFGRFSIPFGLIDIASEGRGGPLWSEDFGIYGLGNTRTFFAFQDFCGVLVRR